VVSDLWPITGIVDGDTINVLILANRSGSASLLFMHQLRFAQATDTPCQLDSGLDLEALFFTRISRTVLKDGTVRIEGKLYELDLSLRALPPNQGRFMLLGLNLPAACFRPHTGW
jgi:hypothetical protein